MRFIAVGAVAAMMLAGPVAGAVQGESASSAAAATTNVQALTVVEKKPQAKKRAKYDPPSGVFFNIPRGPNPADQWVIEQQIVRAINATPKGEFIRISVFSFDRMPVADALIAARKRGVRVQVLWNNHQVNNVMRTMYKQIGRSPKKRNFAYACKGGCRSGFENLHSKFFLFSKTGTAKNVVMLGATNLTGNAAVNQWNDLYVLKEKAKIHASFVKLFEQMRRDKHIRRANYTENLGSRWQLQVFPFLAWNSKNDPVIKVLNKVRCTTAEGAPGGVKGRTMVRVNMHTWADARGEYLARKVRKLYAAGCDVKVMYGMASKNVRDVFAMRTKRGALPVHIHGYDTDYDGLIDLYGHQKMLTIAGHWGKERKARYTWTGSSNWTNAGMRGDEIIFRIKGNAILRAYHKNFNYIWKNRSHLAKYINYATPNNSSLGVNGRRATPEAETYPKPGGPAWEEG